MGLGLCQEQGRPRRLPTEQTVVIAITQRGPESQTKLPELAWTLKTLLSQPPPPHHQVWSSVSQKKAPSNHMHPRHVKLPLESYPSVPAWSGGGTEPSGQLWPSPRPEAGSPLSLPSTATHTSSLQLRLPGAPGPELAQEGDTVCKKLGTVLKGSRGSNGI